MANGFEEMAHPGDGYRYHLIDMRTIDCERFLTLDNPDALVLAILFDFKGRNAREMVSFILRRLNALTGDNAQQFGKYMTMLEELAANRELQQLVQEVEKMLSEINLEKHPSFQIGMERDMKKGEQEANRASAKAMLAKGFEPALIHEITGLPLETIQQLIGEA